MNCICLFRRNCVSNKKNYIKDGMLKQAALFYYRLSSGNPPLNVTTYY